MEEKWPHLCLNWLFLTFTMLFMLPTADFRAQREWITHSKNQPRKWHCYPCSPSPSDGTGSTRGRQPLGPLIYAPVPLSVAHHSPTVSLRPRLAIEEPSATRLLLSWFLSSHASGCTEAHINTTVSQRMEWASASSSCKKRKTQEKEAQGIKKRWSRLHHITAFSDFSLKDLTGHWKQEKSLYHFKQCRNKNTKQQQMFCVFALTPVL